MGFTLDTTIDMSGLKNLEKSLRNFWLKVQNRLKNIGKILEIQFNLGFPFPRAAYEFYRIFYIPGFQTEFSARLVIFGCSPNTRYTVLCNPVLQAGRALVERTRLS